MTAFTLRLLLVIAALAAISGPMVARAQTTPAQTTPAQTTTAQAATAQAATPPTVSPTAPAPPVAMPGPRMTAPDYRMGDPKAKVTVVEYASDTCPHCAKFAAEIFPAFKAKYVDTGKVLYIFREFPTSPEQLSAAGFVMSRCAGEAKYFDVVNALFKAQTTAKSGLDFLMAGAKVGGLSEDQVKACLNDPASLTELNARVQTAVKVDKITGTPTLTANGKEIAVGETTMKDLDAAIAPLLAPTKAKVAQKRHKA